MPTIILCNIGNSDIRVDGQKEPPRPARPVGEQLYAEYTEHTFELPILEPYLRYFTDRRIVIDRFVMFDTDQDDTEATRVLDRWNTSMRDKDTLWFGKIIEKYLSDHWNQLVKSVERRTIRNINPSLYDDAMDEFGQQLRSIYTPHATYFVLVAGGTQAFNNALQLKALARFGEACQVLYKSENEDTPFQLTVGQQLQQTFNIQASISALQRLDFAGAVSLLASLNDPIVHILRYLHYREAFNFDGAIEEWQKASRQAHGTLRTVMRTHETKALAIQQIQEKDLFVELANSLEIAFKQQRYADFLGRIFRFQEALLRSMVEQVFGISTDMSSMAKNTTSLQFKQLLSDIPDLAVFLDNRQINGQPLNYANFSMPVLDALLDYALKDKRKTRLDKGTQGSFSGIYHILKKFNELKDLRNQSIIAHGFEGVSLERINRLYPGNVLDDVAEIMKKLQIKQERHLFSVITEYAVAHLKQIM